jgi:hypothetical protein
VATSLLAAISAFVKLFFKDFRSAGRADMKLILGGYLSQLRL